MVCRRLGRAVDLECLRRVFGLAPATRRATPRPARPPAPPDPAGAPTPGQVAWLAALTAAERARFERAAGAVPGQIPGVASGGGQPRPDPRGRGGAAASAQDPTDARPVTGRTVRLDGRAGPPPAPAGAVNIREGEIRGPWIGRPTSLIEGHRASSPHFLASTRQSVGTRRPPALGDLSRPVEPMKIEQLVDSGQVIPIDSHALSIRGG